MTPQSSFDSNPSSTLKALKRIPLKRLRDILLIWVRIDRLETLVSGRPRAGKRKKNSKALPSLNGFPGKEERNALDIKIHVRRDERKAS